MAHMTLNISDELAARLRPLGVWLPTALELTLVGCKTVAAATATEVLEFLAQGPTPDEVLGGLDQPVQNRIGIDLEDPGCPSDAQPFGQARDHAHDELLRCALTVEDRAVGLIKISAARDAL
jgi:hypothetical protein